MTYEEIDMNNALGVKFMDDAESMADISALVGKDISVDYTNPAAPVLHIDGDDFYIGDYVIKLESGEIVKAEAGIEVVMCQHCSAASYTDKPFRVITQLGREVEVPFNFCPVCGRHLRVPN